MQMLNLSGMFTTISKDKVTGFLHSIVNSLIARVGDQDHPVLKQLARFEIEGTALHGAAKSLVPLLECYPLAYINFDDCGLGSDVAAIADALAVNALNCARLGHVPSLQSLFLGQNIAKRKCSHLARMLRVQTGLETLNLTRMDFRGEGFEEVIDALGACYKLTHLTLEDNILQSNIDADDDNDEGSEDEDEDRHSEGDDEEMKKAHSAILPDISETSRLREKPSTLEVATNGPLHVLLRNLSIWKSLVSINISFTNLSAHGLGMFLASVATANLAHLQHLAICDPDLNFEDEDSSNFEQGNLVFALEALVQLHCPRLCSIAISQTDHSLDPAKDPTFHRLAKLLDDQCTHGPNLHGLAIEYENDDSINGEDFGGEGDALQDVLDEVAAVNSVQSVTGTDYPPCRHDRHGNLLSVDGQDVESSPFNYSIDEEAAEIGHDDETHDLVMGVSLLAVDIIHKVGSSKIRVITPVMSLKDGARQPHSDLRHAGCIP